MRPSAVAFVLRRVLYCTGRVHRLESHLACHFDKDKSFVFLSAMEPVLV